MIDDDGDDLSSAPLPPDDRLWRHPSELAAASRRPSPRRPLVAIGVVSGLAGAAAAVVALTALGAFSAGTVEERDLVATPTSTTTTAPPPTTVVATARAVATSVAASVVEVTATSADGTVSRASGVVARSDGLVLTSAQLISGAGAVVVTWPSGRREDARVEGVDTLTGLAAVSVTGDGFPTAALDITPPRLGEQAITVSARSGVTEPTVVVGRVSATGTHVTAGEDVLVGLIETDTPIPADADGGALVDGDGNLRGVCLSLGDEDGAAAGWAVPTEVALRVADDLRRLGRVDRGWLGVQGESADVDGAVPAGFAVSEPKPGSPAETAGMLPGDVLISVDDHRVRSLDDVRSALTLTRPGQTVVVELNRGDQTLELPVVLSTAPTE